MMVARLAGLCSLSCSLNDKQGRVAVPIPTCVDMLLSAYLSYSRGDSMDPN
jgi:hypothetical protein